MSGKIGRPCRRSGVGTGRLLCGTSLSALMLLVISTPAQAQDTVHWDGGNADGGNPLPDANGGAGTWNNTLTNWDTTATGGSDTAWTAGDDAIFGGSIAGTTKTVTLGAPITAHSLTFNTNDYVLTGNTLTLSGAGAGVSGAGDARINSVIAGSDGLIKSGGGNLQLGGANTLTGGITVSGGTLWFLSGSSINGAGNILHVNSGAGLYIQTSNAFGGDTAASRLLMDDGARLQLLSGANLTHDITFTNGGTPLIYGNGTWNGTAVLNAATTLRLGGSTLTVAGNLSDNGGVLSLDTATLGGTILLTGNLSHTGGLTVGNDTRLSGTNTYSGDTIVAQPSGGESRLTYSNAGALSANSNVVLGDALTAGLVRFGYGSVGLTLGNGGGQFRFNGSGGFLSTASGPDVTLTLNGGAGLTWGAGNFIGNGNTLYIGADTSAASARELDLTNDIDLGTQLRAVYGSKGTIADHGVLSGTLSGTGGLQIVGDGLLELSGTNTYTGATEVQSTLMLGSAGALPGGIGVAGGLSNLQLNGLQGTANTDDGVVVLTAASGDFLRGLGTGGDQVQWLADGGFTAVGATRTVNIGNGAALTWGEGGFVGDDRRLVFGGTYGNAAIDFQNSIDLGTQTRTIEINNIATNDIGLNLNGVISGNGGLIITGTGDVALTGLNTFTGNAILGDGTTLSDDLEVTVTTIGNAGSAGNLGAGNTIELKAHAGVLNYLGTGETTNRNWILGGRSSNAIISINNNGSGALELTGNITKDATGAANTLRLQGSFASSDVDGDGVADNPNIASGVIAETSGTLHVEVRDGSTWRLTGNNTYSGSTSIISGVLEVETVADGATSSSIGDSSNAASNLYIGNNSTLRVIGAGGSTDRLMQVLSASRIDSSGTGAVQFTNPGLLERGGSSTGTYRLTLGGTNTDDNSFALTLTDFSSGGLGLTKDGAGLWALTTNNNAQAYAFTNNTIISGGALRLDNAGAITGGLGTSSSHGLTGSPQRSSLIQFNGTATTGGVLGLTAASGPFTRGLTTEADAFLNNNGTAVGVDPDGAGPLPPYGAEALDDDNYVQGVRWTGSGGFAAWDGVQIVNIFGDGRELTWNTGGFVPTGSSLVFGYETADGTVDFQNDINLTNAARTVQVNNGIAAVDAILSGVVASTTTGGGLIKTGEGTLALTNANTYTGVTAIDAGTLQIGMGGSTGTLGAGDVTVAADAVLAFDRSNAYLVNNQITGAGTLRQQGTGTTTLTAATNEAGATEISAGTLQIDGTLETPTVAMTGTSSLTVNGTVGAAAGGISAITGNAGAQTVTVAGGGTLRASGDLGGGSDVLNLTGTLDTGGGTFDLGLGNDTFTLNDGGTFTGTVSGGAGTDALQVNNAAGRTLDASQVTSFESLTKSLGGTLTLTGDHGYSDGVVISGGVLRIGDGGTSGSISGDILNNASLVFDRSDELTYGGVISGSGSVDQNGSGTTILTGGNSYTGVTNVNAGTLLVNGDQSLATGLTSVASGATLGGIGIIGGDVAIADGGILTPGSGGAGELTINGGLLLSDASLLEFEFGQANVVGGPLNDVVNVGGDLTLDGTVNVTEPAGGTFGPGVYRMFNYGGTLTDNGLIIGDMPGGSDVFVQTAIASQVNLVNTAGLTFNFWDGDAGPKNNDAIDGGNGTWRLDGGNNNWTGMDGALNADYAQDSFAVFQGAAGTVTVDNSGGNVLTAGMQFDSDGYLVTGDVLTLTGAQAFINVSDGYTATIDAELAGSAQLVKAFDGTLVLSGTNSYTGGTAINAGTLEISSDANLGNAAGGLTFNGGTLHTTADIASGRTVDLAGNGTIDTDALTALTLSGVVSGAGTLIKDGDGTLILLADNTYTGTTTISAGTLQIGNGGTTGSIPGDILNNSALLFDRSDTLTYGGVVSGTGSLEQAGSGTLVLTNASTYTGGTTITGGTLQLGDGGTTGSIVGDVANNGTLAFSRSDEITFAGLISGTGALDQLGPGTTILTANNSYAGATNVDAGTLLINGDQSLATGPTNVASGATLGGTGIIGGNVLVAGGGILSPGSNDVGTLTVRGDLVLGATALLDYEFGESNVVGGFFNDLLVVDGNLTLDGTISVAVSSGGSFDPGLYRVISYGGTLTDNGLAVGSMPPGSDVEVQTSIAGQVNLVNTAGLALNFWDGAAGPKNDSAVNGGDGTWHLGGADNNWTDSNGAVNAAYADGSFAIFSAAPGTVTVDNSQGDVTASGMQFFSDGYTVTGDALTLVGANAIVSVGDHTEMGAAYSATIAAELTGAAGLEKTDLGTLILTGANSYSGGTTVTGGTLQIGDGGTTGSIVGDVVTNAALVFDRSDDVTFGGLISGIGTITQAGTGTTIFTADNSYTGGTTITAGTLQIGDGGTSGSIVGDVLNDAALVFNRSDDIAFAGLVSGTGTLMQIGAGTLILTGGNSYTGATDVIAGSLLINGDQSLATGLTSVASGAMLGGMGIIGGDVNLADGATLQPGSNDVGTLTINGNLSLSSGSILDMELGQAGAIGGSLNDLIEVGGDLTLDGTINVSVPAAGEFGPGVYRVINYGGTLTDNGLDLGTLPDGSAVEVQTSIDGQVNLVNGIGVVFNFWDGDAGPKDDSQVNGGDGVWQNSTGNDNWTDANGVTNGGYQDGGFAIFQGAAGTVTVDDSLGAVTSSGMQFAIDGYVITGDSIELVGTEATIRVGDASSEGASYVATIESELTGSAQLVKTDYGTLVLSGTNTYTGGTSVNGGILQISSDANLGAAEGDVTFNGGTLQTTADITTARDFAFAGSGAFLTDADTTYTVDGVVSGTGTFAKDGEGVLVLTADSSAYLGNAQILGGTMVVNGTLGGTLDVEDGRLEGTGIVGATTNFANGVIAPGVDGFGMLTINGGYSGNGGVLEMDVELGGDSSPTDLLLVNGATAGNSAVRVINLGGTGAQTHEGIKIIDVVGGSSNGEFMLLGDYDFEGSPAVIAGAYGYRLFQGGVSTPADGDWYLRSALLDAPNGPEMPLYQPGVPIYESYGQTLQILNGLPTLHERVGNRQWSGFTESGIGMWGRIEAGLHRPEAVISTSNTDVDTGAAELQAGFDKALHDSSNGILVAGINGRLAVANARIRSQFGSGEIDSKGYGLGVTLTWYGAGGFYVDAQAQASWYDSDLDSDVVGNLVNNSDGSGEAFSLEAGQRLPIGGSLSLTPQAQVVYSNVRFDAFADPYDAAVSSEEGGSLRGRLGLSLDHHRSWQREGGQTARAHLYGFANLDYEMLDGTRAAVSDTPVFRRDDRLWGELGIGGSYSFADGKFAIYSEISANTALSNFGESNVLRANAGFRMQF